MARLSGVDGLDLLLLVWIGYYLVLAPFTKIEESFNIQAVHDVIYHGVHISKYDHFEFPGPVPRTFIGAVVLGGLAKLPSLALPSGTSKLQVLLIARGILGFINGTSLIYFRRAVERLYGVRRGRAVGRLFVLFTLGQFHVLFYASRTLPNMLAFPLVMVSFAWTLDARYEAGLWLLSFAAAVFRSELAVLAGALGIALVLSRKIRFGPVFFAGLYGAGFGAVLSTLVDSVFWRQYPTFPELQGLIFNVVRGKAVEWGTQPWDAYFALHLPNLFANPVIMFLGLVGASVTPRNLQMLGLAAVAYVFIYSFQPHKELRFVIYVAPVWTALAARATDYIYYNQWRKSLLARLLVLGTLGTAFLAIAASLAKAKTSADNYPGGYALKRFHSVLPDAPRGDVVKTVHIDVSTKMSGATRFGHDHPFLIYDRTEGSQEIARVAPSFDYYIGAMENPAQLPVKPGYEWQVRDAVPAFVRLDAAFAKSLLKQALKDPHKAIEVVQGFLWPLDGLRSRFDELWYRLVVLEDTVFVYESVPVSLV